MQTCISIRDAYASAALKPLSNQTNGGGVVDSISGYEPLDLFESGYPRWFDFQSGYGVVDIMTVCGTVDPGSSPGTWPFNKVII